MVAGAIYGATTLSIITFSIRTGAATFIIMTLIINVSFATLSMTTISIKGFFDIQHK